MSEIQIGIDTLDLSERVVVLAQNVYDYCADDQHSPELPDTKGFICVRAPFAKMAIRFCCGDPQKPFYSTVGRDGVRLVNHENVAVMINSHVRAGFVPPQRADFSLDAQASHVLEMWLDGETWGVRCFLQLDKTGRLLKSYTDVPRESAERHASGFPYSDLPELADDRAKQIRTSDQILGTGAQAMASVALVTIQFMNCRNVEIIDNPPTRQQRRAAERVGNPPPISYKTLHIRGTRKVRPRSGQEPADEPQSGIALHICRGHFKDFRSGPGLGKYHSKGLWWWAPLVRGTSKRGLVRKTYDVETDSGRAS